MKWIPLLYVFEYQIIIINKRWWRSCY